jgi:soluble lytic murein transglycosylase-like protein
MDRASVAGIGMLAALLVSGWQDASETAPAAVRSAVSGRAQRFGEVELARFLDGANPALSQYDVGRISTAVIRYSSKYDLDPLLVTQVLWVESGARPWVRSPLGAIGLMQVMPHMAEPLSLSGNLAAIETNIEAGCWILADNIRRLGEEDGISAYFWGSDIRSVAYLHRVREARAAIRGESKS